MVPTPRPWWRPDLWGRGQSLTSHPSPVLVTLVPWEQAGPTGEGLLTSDDCDRIESNLHFAMLSHI